MITTIFGNLASTTLLFKEIANIKTFHPILLVRFRESNFLSEHCLMLCLLNKKLQVFKTTLANLNFNLIGVLTF